MSELSFHGFFIGTIFLLLVVSSTLPISLSVLENLTPEQLSRIKDSPSLPEAPGVLDYLGYSFNFLYDFANKIILVLQVSTKHQIVAAFLTPLIIVEFINVFRTVAK